MNRPTVSRPDSGARDGTDDGGAGRAPAGPPRDYPAERARGARIVLNTPARRYVFFGGLIALVLFAIVMAAATRVIGQV